MTSPDVQSLCEEGQQLLMQTQYWEAERILAQAEAIAWESHDWDALSRLYMPLQEARRQRRQRCGEGIVALGLLSQGPADIIDPAQIISHYPHGQLLVAGWGTIEPAIAVRDLAAKNKLYVETFLAAVYPIGPAKAVVIVPTPDVTLPSAAREWSIDELIPKLPVHTIVLNESELPQQIQRGDTQTYARTMALWERLAAPFLAAADQSPDAIGKAEGYRKTIRVDYACELAHQKLSDLAKKMNTKMEDGGRTMAK